MHRRELIVAGGAGAAGVLAGCAELVDDSASRADDAGTPTDDSTESPGALLTVSATGSVAAEPEQAVANVGVEATDDSAAAVRDEVAERARAVREALLDAGVPDENIRTTRFYIREPSREPGFRGGHQYRVVIEDTERVGGLIDVAVDAGANDLGRVQFTLSEETSEELREEALDAAIENARSEAEAIAASKGLTIERVEAVSTSRTSVRPASLHGGAGGAAMAAASTDIDAGPVTVSAQVEIEYVASQD